MIDPETLQVTQHVTSVLDALEIPYAIGGSVASSIHGVIRTTMDVDIVADIQPPHVSPFVKALMDKFYLDEPTIRQAVTNRGAFNIIHYETMVKIDIFVRQGREFDQQQLARRSSERVSPEAETTLWVLSPEDVVLAKLEWYRLGGEVSERQWRDVLGVLKTQQDNLDLDYLREWADKLGVTDLLAHALVDAEIIG